MKNVALFGQMASGKSAIAAALVDSGYIQMSFAQPLKNISELAYGKIDKSGEYTVTSLDGIEQVISGREVLQRVGQAIKEHDRDFWLRCFFRAADNLLDQPIVVDDGRFAFERDALSRRGWLIVGIDTPKAVRMERYRMIYGRYPTDVEMSHQSEIELPDIIVNADIILDGTDDPYMNLRAIRMHGAQA
jgi:hypothetical protein